MLGLADAVELLIENGANVNAQDYMQFSPLHWAAAQGDLFRVCFRFNKRKIFNFFSLFKFFSKKRSCEDCKDID